MTNSPDGNFLYAFLQTSIEQDRGEDKNNFNTRLLEFDIQKKNWTGEWIVQLPTLIDPVSGKLKALEQNELHWLDENKFFVLSRDSNKGYGQADSSSLYRQVDHR